MVADRVPEGADESTKYSILPRDISFCNLVYTAKLRRRIERELPGTEQEVGAGAAFIIMPPVHRCLRIPGLRKGDDSPLRISFRWAVLATYRTRRLQTQRISRCGLNGSPGIRYARPTM
jgi:hypothetical protein